MSLNRHWIINITRFLQVYSMCYRDTMVRYISLKLLYFLQAAGGAPILPFISVILKQLGVTGTGFGFGLALIGLTGIVARSIISSLIDKYKSRRALCFKILIFGSIIGFGIMFALFIQQLDLFHFSMSIIRYVLVTFIKSHLRTKIHEKYFLFNYCDTICRPC